jgi:hypothetical protein
VLFDWWATADQDHPDMTLVIKIIDIMNGDRADKFGQAIRALAGKGE